MATVNVQPKPESYRKYGRFVPGPPPIFTDGDPTPADVELARELFKALDDDSKRWYRHRSGGIFADLMPNASEAS